MTDEQSNKLILMLSRILMQPMEFNGLRCEISYVNHARHSRHWVIQPHYHPWFEFNYVAEGSVYTSVKGQEFLANAGQSYLIAPEVVHAHRHNNTGDTGLCIRFSLEAEKNHAQAREVLAVLSRPRPYSFSSGIEHIPDADGIFGIQAAFLTWLMRLYETWSEGDGFSATLTSNTVSSQVMIYLKEYYKTKIRMEDLAAALNISYRSLARRFRTETGTTISQQLTRLRLDTAKKLLTDSNLPLYDIAAAVGYENEFYFSNIFKKNEGISPSRFRREQNRLLP